VGVGGLVPPQARNLTCGGGLVPPDRHRIACRYRQLVPPPKKVAHAHVCLWVNFCMRVSLEKNRLIVSASNSSEPQVCNQKRATHPSQSNLSLNVTPLRRSANFIFSLWIFMSFILKWCLESEMLNRWYFQKTLLVLFKFCFRVDLFSLFYS